jgi:hypothetical protein
MFAAKPTIEIAIRLSFIAVRLFNGLSPVTVSANSPGDSQTTPTTSSISNDIVSGLSGRDVERTNLTGVLR